MAVKKRGEPTRDAKPAPPLTTTKPRPYLKQSDLPKLTLSEALRVPQSLYDDFAGRSAAPHQLAMAVDISPTSSAWEDLCGAAMAYGLTDGGSKASGIALTDLG